MSQLFVVGGIAIALLALLWAANRIKGRKTHALDIRHENDQLRHTITEMAKERHHTGHHGRKSR